MKDLSKEATHLVRQGKVLRWKNPYEKPTLNEFKDPLWCKTGDCKAYRDCLEEWQSFETFSEANPIHLLGDWPDKKEFSREEVEIIHVHKSMPEFNGADIRLAARYKGKQELDKNESDILEKTYKRLLSDSPTSLLNPTDINVGQLKEEEQGKEECSHEPLVDTGIGYYHCPACNKGWTYKEWLSVQLTDLDVKHLLYYGETANRKIVIDSDGRIDLPLYYMFNQLNQEVREKIEPIFWSRIKALLQPSPKEEQVELIDKLNSLHEEVAKLPLSLDKYQPISNRILEIKGLIKNQNQLP